MNVNNFQPLVSIVTVVRNGEKFLEQTLRSVTDQSYSNIEYIVIDGLSNDNTMSIIEKFRDTINVILSESDYGQTDALKKGFDLSKGEILCWMNYDDIFYSNDTVKSIVDVFINNNVDLVYGNDILVDSEMNTLYPRFFSNHSLNKLLFYKSISQPSSFFSRRAYKTIGLNEKLVFSMDLDFWIKIFSKYNIQYIDKFLSYNRIHEDRKMILYEKEARIESNFLRSQYNNNEFKKNVLYMYFKLTDFKNIIAKVKYKFFSRYF